MTMTDNPRPESARHAIDLRTAWLDNPDGPADLLLTRLQALVDEDPGGNKVAGAVRVIMGMTYLCGSLLLLREHETGITARETLSALGLHYALE